MSERLRRWTRNPLGSARRGSNPLAVAFPLHLPMADCLPIAATTQDKLAVALVAPTPPCPALHIQASGLEWADSLLVNAGGDHGVRMLFMFAWHAPDSGAKSPYRLVVRTSRCGRDNPGSTPGEDILPTRMQSSCTLSIRMPAHALFYKTCVVISSTPPAVPLADHLATCQDCPRGCF